MDSQHNRASRKSAKPQEAEDTATSFTVGNPLQLKQSKASQNREIEARMDDVLSWTKKNRKSAAWSDNSSYLESDDSCDSNRLQIAWNGDNNETQSNHSEGSESSGSTNDTQSMLHFKNSLQSHPLKRYNAVITMTEAKIPLIYHKSMARQFPSKQRTPEQMEMRRRNTEAARVSRAKMKMAELLMQKEANELSTANLTHKQMIASQLVYANALSKLLDMQSVDLKFFERVGQRKGNSA
ncbi:uncharacterized protein LOC128714708 [Anopheles marshallii]|uniref:uncharacterized protein LOC128714708 n=1 Tax=Anopheles marshallii TaxID=1521116 RepID=UPI00237C4B08|nr:uncharacterized protein LOC128714708 [Anopheles marshallii]